MRELLPRYLAHFGQRALGHLRGHPHIDDREGEIVRSST
jgi:hypothetical protein